MASKDDRRVDAAELRRRAEEIARKRADQSPANIEAMSPDETRRTFHELRVHQIELEMQNEELRRAQTELDAARARYFDLYDLAPVGYVTLSEDGLIQEANLTAANLLGVARGSLVQQLLTRFIVQEDQDIYYLHRKRLFETREPQACELRMVKGDGTSFWAHLAATATKDVDGASPVADAKHPSVCRVVMSEVTERKQAEEALRQLSARHEAILSEIPDIVMEVDENKVYTWANAVGLEFFGEDAVGREAADFFVGEQATYQTVQPLFAGDTATFYVESWQRRKDGQKRLLAWWCRALKDADGRVTGALSTARDITDRLLAEEALRESEQRLSSIYDTVGDVLYHLAVEAGETYRFISINQAFSHVTGLEREQVVGKTVNEVIPEPSLTMVLGNYREAIDEKRIVHWEETSDYPNGRLTGEVSIAPVCDDEGHCTHLVGSVHDVTERKRAEEKIKGQLEELQRWQAVMLGREDRVRELKREINGLCRRAGEPLRYPSQVVDAAETEAAEPKP